MSLSSSPFLGDFGIAGLLLGETDLVPFPAGWAFAAAGCFSSGFARVKLFCGFCYPPAHPPIFIISQIYIIYRYKPKLV